jgi:peptidoglycan/LPS O-acetylase OafA/YrhL
VELRRLGYVPALDGIRGVAILLVVSWHYLGVPLGGGPIGVDLFFVVSGFLITTLLLEERDRAGRLSLRRFYARRARRLFPALAVLLAVYVLVRAALGQDGLPTAALAGLYVGNIVQAFGLHNIVTSTCLAHLWSLAQEEQFYLVWPLVLVLVVRARRALLVLVALILGVMLYRAALALDGASWARLYYGPDTRSDWLLAGAALALARRRGFQLREPWPLLGFVILFVSLFFDTNSRAWQTWESPIFLVGATLLVAAAYGQTQMAQLLSMRPLVGVGKISYSLYLWHIPVYVVVGYKHPELAAPAAFAVAWLSYRYIEQPFRRGTSTLRPTPPLAETAPQSV